MNRCGICFRDIQVGFMEIHKRAAWELWPGIDGDKEETQTPRELDPNSLYPAVVPGHLHFLSRRPELGFSRGCAGLSRVTQAHPQVPSEQCSGKHTRLRKHTVGSRGCRVPAKGEVSWLLGTVISRQSSVHTALRVRAEEKGSMYVGQRPL